MMIPFMTASPVSHKSVGDGFEESFISRKDAHSLLMRLLNSGSFRSDVLKRHVGVGLCGLGWFHLNDTGAWSLMMMGWIRCSEMFGIIEILVRKRSIREYE